MQFRLKTASLLCALLLLTGQSISIALVRTEARAQQDSISVSTNEGRAMKSLRWLHGVEETYKATVGPGEYADLKQLYEANLVDKELASGIKDGYRFVVAIKKGTLSSPPSFELLARPVEYGKSGKRSFYMGLDGVLFTSEVKDAPISEMRPFATGTGEARPNTAAANVPTGEEPTGEENPAGDINANEAAIISLLKAIHTAETTYKTKAGNGQYGTLEQLEKQELLAKGRAATIQHGYVLTVTVRPGQTDLPPGFMISVAPETYGISGRRSFYIDHSGTLRGADKEGGPADGADPVIEK